MKLSALLLLLLFSTITRADTYIQAGPSYPVCDLTTLACGTPGSSTLFYMDPTIPDSAPPYFQFIPFSQVYADLSFRKSWRTLNSYNISRWTFPTQL
jgi:hypothetical protein